MRQGPTGFTLIEVMVGVLLTSVVVSLAAAMTFALTDTLDAIKRSGGRTSVVANGRIWLRELAWTVDVRDEPGFVFVGSPTGCSFSASVWTAGGWGEASSVRILLERTNSSTRVIVHGIGPTPLQVARLGPSAHIEYLIQSAGNRLWVSDWITETVPPIAIRISDASAADLLLFIGERG